MIDDTYLERVRGLREEVGKTIVGNGHVIDLMLTAIFAGGHILIESPPGLGKTLLTKTIAQCLKMKFSRIQATSDLEPSDILGANVCDGSSNQVFRKGPLFANVVLVDEINRACPKTQSAFLEAMEEQSVTLYGCSNPVGNPFTVFATQNPIEAVGTFPLAEAQADRFLIKTFMDYPSRDQERSLLKNQKRDFKIEPVFDAVEVLHIQDMIQEDIILEDEILDIALDIITHTRDRKEVLCGASTRCSVMFCRALKAMTFLRGRDLVLAEDVRCLAKPLLRHRMVMNSDSKNFGYTSDDVIDDILRRTF